MAPTRQDFFPLSLRTLPRNSIWALHGWMTFVSLCQPRLQRTSNAKQDKPVAFCWTRAVGMGSRPTLAKGKVRSFLPSEGLVPGRTAENTLGPASLVE